jgi:hypothetical protein
MPALHEYMQYEQLYIKLLIKIRVFTKMLIRLIKSLIYVDESIPLDDFEKSVNNLYKLNLKIKNVFHKLYSKNNNFLKALILYAKFENDVTRFFQEAEELNKIILKKKEETETDAKGSLKFTEQILYDLNTAVVTVNAEKVRSFIRKTEA